MMLETSTSFKAVVSPCSVILISINPNVFSWSFLHVVLHRAFISCFIWEPTSAVPMLSILVPISLIFTEIFLTRSAKQLNSESMSNWLSFWCSIHFNLGIKIFSLLVLVDHLAKVNRVIFELVTYERTLIHEVNVHHYY